MTRARDEVTADEALFPLKAAALSEAQTAQFVNVVKLSRVWVASMRTDTHKEVDHGIVCEQRYYIYHGFWEGYCYSKVEYVLYHKLHAHVCSKTWFPFCM